MRWTSRVSQLEFQSTLPARGATFYAYPRFVNMDISIHAPREGSDKLIRREQDMQCISIHAPREGSDLRRAAPLRGGGIFQSTLPARGATRRPASVPCSRYFNPRSPRGERLRRRPQVV